MLALSLALLSLAAFVFTAVKTKAIEARFPRLGELTDVGGFRMNAVHAPKPENADLPAIVFIHGASGNLRDQMTAFSKILEGRAEMLFVDRPGHGYSERGGKNMGFPDGQADAIARLMQAKGMTRAIICGHSFGGAIAASFALKHKQMTAGLLLLAPATHPWPGSVDWYYRLATKPYLGWIFTRLFSLPAGLMLMNKATHAVFHPNPRPESYEEDGAPALVLRPESFRSNAIDVANLNAYAAKTAPRYAEISAPTIVVTGDSDAIVAAEIHAAGILKTVPGARLVTVRGLGHKPDYIATDLVVAAIETLAGRPRDLDAAVRAAEARIMPTAKEPLPELDLSVEKF